MFFSAVFLELGEKRACAPDTHSLDPQLDVAYYIIILTESKSYTNNPIHVCN